MTRQQRRAAERKFKNPSYTQGYKDGVDQSLTLMEKAINEVMTNTKGIGDKRKMEIEKGLTEYFMKMRGELK